MKCWKLRRYSLLICFICFFGSIKSQTTVDILASKDNTLYEDINGTLSNGAGQHFFAGNTSQASNINTRRAVIQFDVAGVVPAGALITQVELKLNMSQSAGGTEDVSIFRLLKDWGEGTSDAAGGEGSGAPATTGDATWVHTNFTTAVWDDLGGDFIPNSSATTAVFGSVGQYTWSSGNMINDVQDWLLNPANNFGWIIRGKESGSSTAKRFDSRDHPMENVRPVLTVSYMNTTVMAIPAAKDNTLYESDTGGISNGSGDYFFVGKPIISNVRRRAVIQFDLTGQVPSGATVEGALLQLEMSRTQAATETINLHKLTADWGEGTSDATGNEGAGAPSTVGDATWQHQFYNSTFWTNDGGDFVTTSSGSQEVGDEAKYFWSSTGMVSDIQDWVDTPSDNFGWILIGNESTFLTTKRFNSRENAECPPALYVFYSQSVPVDLIAFEGRREGRTVSLDWATATEIDNKGFEIEHSQNGSDFRSIGFVDGYGNSTELRDYNFRDLTPSVGKNFYRLKQHDFSGKHEYSKLVTVEMPSIESNERLIVFPNPANSYITIQQVEDSHSTLFIYNQMGKLIEEVKLSDISRNVLTLDISNYPKGSYYIQGNNGEKSEFVKL